MVKDIARAFENITNGMRTFFGRAGFKRAVIGSSGGIDSSVVICLAVKVLGPENVYAVSLPSKYSDDASHSLAKELADNLGLEPFYLPINMTYNLMAGELKERMGIEYDPKEDHVSVTLENLQSRIRMVYLMALANEKEALLLNTGNHTEFWLGYTTLYGDLAGVLAPIVDLTKIQVYEMGRFINSNMFPVKGSDADQVIPEYVFKRKPSAELNAGQVDPFDYETYSELCRVLCDKSLDVAEQLMLLLCEEYGEEIVMDAFKRMRGNRFKRSQAPPGVCALTGGILE